MQRRCDRNRKRSQRRAIICPIHGDYLHSVSQKYSLFADQAEQLQSRGIGRRNAVMLVATRTTILLSGEWLEAFWCDECQQTQWYHIRKLENNRYQVNHAPAELWQQAIGVTQPHGNPSVSEFTRTSSRMTKYQTVKDFNFVN
ncbi:MAG: hypothetical protein HC780_05080 [Leptolyngbyaceae cyanobacterium CSU_1_3]|nr:hypothetical protein [Leptolyngbyaceae cyanobacterium CSU_1_3]